MKSIAVILLPVFTLQSSSAVPLTWTVETSRVKPAAFEAYQGETLEFEAALCSNGKPLAAPLNYSFFWQTNGMGNVYWSTNVASAANHPTNVMFATWTPSMDVGARAYTCFLGAPGTIYHAAFQLRLRPSPGAVPNALPLPTPTIDFARVTVTNAPWATPEDMPDGSARPLPKHLHALDFDDGYPGDAKKYYRIRGAEESEGGCSAVRSGNFLYRNFDFPFDDRAEFIVRMSAGPGRLASVGVAQVGTNLTERMVTSGSPEYSARYKWLPGATVDGINENGVVAEINVVNGDPQTSGWLATGDIHPLGAVRWVLDNAKTAEDAATNLAVRIAFPQGWTQNFHFMIADERETYIVENGAASNVTAVAAKRVMTNFPILPDDYEGMGAERYVLLLGGASITNAWYTNAYRRETNPPWFSEFGNNYEYLNAALNRWNDGHTKEQHRGESYTQTTYPYETITWWQTVHTSVYDITNRVLRIAVQETDDWYVFQVPSSCGGSSIDTNAVIDIAQSVVAPAVNAAVNTGRAITASAATDGTNYTDTAVSALSSTVSSQLSQLTDNKLDVHFGRGAISWDMRNNKESMTIGGRGELRLDFPDIYSTGTIDAEDVTCGNGHRLSAKADSADVSSLSSQVSGLASSKADSADLAPIRTAANDALSYGRGVFMYLNGTTNCYFSGTNYVIGAESTNRTAFALEEGMDLATVPCSMALWEIRDGTRQCVWDQRDWTVWYWNFKIEQYRSEHDGRDAALRALIEGRCPLNWASYTACGLTNAAGDTTWIDTPKVVLAAGYAWQHQLTVDGVGYWGIQGNGFEVGGSGTNSTLRITDWEGNEVLKITKGSARLAYLTSGSGVASGFDGGWMWYDMMCDAQPTGEFTVDLLDTFVEEGDGCPAEVREYVDRGNGVWRCYFRARPGINATACFARFKVQVGTETTVEYGTAPTVPGLIVNGRKIAPVIPANAQVGDTVTWKVVQ